MTNNFDRLDFKTQQDLKGVDFTDGGELVLTQLDIKLTTPELADVSPWEFAHYMAVENWLTEYQPQPNASNLEQVTGYLEAFHHLCEVEAWETASKILFIHPHPDAKELHKQLGTWGYYCEQIQLYSRLLEKLNLDLDCILLDGLGKSYHYLGQLQTAIEYHQRQLEIACQISNPQAEAQARGGLGIVYGLCLDQHQIAFQYYQHQLEIARQIGDRQQEIEALDSLGYFYCHTGQYQKSIKFCQQALALAREIGDRDAEFLILGAIGSTYRLMGQPKKGIDFLQQQLNFCQTTSNRRGEWAALTNLGAIYVTINQYENALDCCEKAMIIIQEIGDRLGEKDTLICLAAIYTRSGRYETAIGYYQQILRLTRQVGNRFLEGYTRASISYCYARLKQHNRAMRNSKLAIKIGREINNKQLLGAAVGTLANAYWHQKNYATGLLLIAQSMLIFPPFTNETSQFMFKTTVETICLALKGVSNLIFSYFQFKQRIDKPTKANKNSSNKIQ